MNADPDPVTAAELKRMIDEGLDDEVAASFAGRLRFGTAGLRGPLGPGPMRMNRMVVAQTARALMQYLDPNPTVVIGYDARTNSEVFARDTADIVVAHGGRPKLATTVVPTPLLAFAVRHYDADLGVMVTASHNPRQDNGYKVYLADGAQLSPPHDAAIEALMDEVDPLTALAGLRSGAGVEEMGPELLAAYLDQVTSVADLSGLRVAYTPLCGVGYQSFARAVEPTGVTLLPVASQVDPDPDFPGLPFPNPEEPGVLDALIQLADEEAVDVAIAHDPDADRLAAVFPTAEGGWQMLTGNQLGAILADHQFEVTSGTDRLAATTVVSSQLLAKQAAAAEVEFAETLTGFKWVMRPAIEAPDKTMVFAYEEALGYAVHPLVRDKDGITAGLALLERVAALRRRGTTVFDRLDQLAEQFGLHVTGQQTQRFEGADARADMTEAMNVLRQSPPAEIGGSRVVDITDFADREGPKTDLLRFDLADGSRVQIRPSGTEAKIKAYIEVITEVAGRAIDEVRREAGARLEVLLSAAADLLQP